jgi:hypothetical protein
MPQWLVLLPIEDESRPPAIRELANIRQMKRQDLRDCIALHVSPAQ